MKTDKELKAIARGNALLVAVEAGTDDVAALEFPTTKFRDAAAARSWTKNHGLSGDLTSMRESFGVRVRRDADFEDGSLRREKVGRSGVVAVVGDLKPHVAEEIARAAETPEEFPELPPSGTTKRVPRRIEFAKQGEIFAVAKQDADGDDPAEVRMFGIVMMPEVPDSEGDITSAEEIAKANDEFMRDFGTLGFMHKKDVSEVIKILQNVIAPVDIAFPLPNGTTKAISQGTWYQELFSDDPEIVERVRNGQITGLSIGGFARRVPVTEMIDGAIRVNVPESFTPAMKRAIKEVVAKAEGDPALTRFVDLRVEEVSVVDAAANEEMFFIIKRRKEMSGKTKEPAAGGVPTAKSPPTASPPTDPPAQDPPVEPTLAEQVATGVAQGFRQLVDDGVITSAAPVAPVEMPAPAEPEPPPAEPVTKDANTAVLEAIGKLGSRLDGIETTQKAQNVKIDQAVTVRAVAKGANAPDDSETPTDDDAPTEPVSKWAGSAIGGIFGKGGRGNK